MITHSEGRKPGRNAGSTFPAPVSAFTKSFGVCFGVLYEIPNVDAVCFGVSAFAMGPQIHWGVADLLRNKKCFRNSLTAVYPTAYEELRKLTRF